MYSFDYSRAKSVADAAAQLKAGDDNRLLAGGMTLLPTMKQRLAQPAQLIDLQDLSDLKGIKIDGQAVVIGAMTRHADVARSAEVAKAIPALAGLAANIGDRQVRHRGTLGGSLANNDPAADYPAAVLGLGASVQTNVRTIAADDFFRGMFETALAEGEIITAVSFPIPKKAAYMKFPNPASRYALVGVFVSQSAKGVRVAVTGAGPGVFRQTEMEAALGKDFSPKAIEGIKVADGNLNSDIHAGADYRAHLIGVMARRAVAACA